LWNWQSKNPNGYADVEEEGESYGIPMANISVNGASNSSSEDGSLLHAEASTVVNPGSHPESPLNALSQLIQYDRSGGRSDAEVRNQLSQFKWPRGRYGVSRIGSRSGASAAQNRRPRQGVGNQDSGCAYPEIADRSYRRSRSHLPILPAHPYPLVLLHLFLVVFPIFVIWFCLVPSSTP